MEEQIMRVDTPLFRGTQDSVNKNLLVSYVYTFEQGGKFDTVRQRANGNMVINPSFGISISEGYDKPQIFIPGIKYYQFTTLLEKTVNAISENLYEIFPNVNRIEFEIDSRVLERFQTEKAMTTAGMTAVPAVWVDETSSCYPGVRINTKNGSVIIPLEDAIPLKEMLKGFDPIVYSINMLRFFGKME